MTASVLAAWVGSIPPAAAQEFPNRPVRIVLPWPPGGTVGSAQVAKASPDGYTRLLGSSVPAITDLLGSQVDSMVDKLSTSIGHIRESRLKPLAVTSRTRSVQ